MILLFVFKFLAGVNVCVALNSSVGQSKNYSDDRLVSHSMRQGFPSSNGTMPVDGEAEHGKSGTAEEDRKLLNKVVAKVSALFEPSSVKKYKIDHAELESHFATLTDEHELVERISKKLMDHSNMDPSVVEMLVKLQEDTNRKQFADATLLVLLKNPKTVQLAVDSWLASDKTPEEIFAFLLQHVHLSETDTRSTWMQFVESDLFSPWLTYVNAYWTKIELTHDDRNSLEWFVRRLFVHEGLTIEAMELALERAKITQDGTNVVYKIVS